MAERASYAIPSTQPRVVHLRMLGVQSLPEGMSTTGVERRDTDDDLCNSPDGFLAALDGIPGSKLVWHLRHGQSTGNCAKIAAWAADAGTGKISSFEAYAASTDHVDARLTEQGCQEAQDAADAQRSWRVRPTLVVCSALTRAIQTAALVFSDLLESGQARLVIRPELREFWEDNNENKGRALEELRRDPALRALPQWSVVERALSEEATADWGDAWGAGGGLAAGPAWRAHCASSERLGDFKVWLSQQRERTVAVVSHYGTINNLMNREPWAEGRKRSPQPAAFWPEGGIVRRFNLRNCGWVTTLMSFSNDSGAASEHLAGARGGLALARDVAPFYGRGGGGPTGRGTTRGSAGPGFRAGWPAQ